MRSCHQCRAIDRELRPAIPGEGGEAVHFVEPEILYVSDAENDDTHWLRWRREGWRPRLYLRRHARERMTCQECLRRNEVRDSVWRGLKADARKMEKAADENTDFYRVLCET